jgi:hypothetical protein
MMPPGYEAERYARDLRASQAEGEVNETWFALQLPVQGQDVPEWEANLYYAAKRLHQLFRLSSYPKAMNHRSLNNLAVLLSTNRDYFFTARPLRCEYSDRAIIAFGLDKTAAQYFIHLDVLIPQAVELAAMGVLVKQVALVEQEAARADF